MDAIASFVSQITGEAVDGGDSFCHDLAQGAALYKLAIVLAASAQVPVTAEPSMSCEVFAHVCRLLSIPVIIDRVDLQTGNIPKVMTCLVFAIHGLYLRGIGAELMDDKLSGCVDSVSGLCENVLCNSAQQGWAPLPARTPAPSLSAMEDIDDDSSSPQPFPGSGDENKVALGRAFVDVDVGRIRAYAAQCVNYGDNDDDNFALG